MSHGMYGLRPRPTSWTRGTTRADPRRPSFSLQVPRAAQPALVGAEEGDEGGGDAGVPPVGQHLQFEGAAGTAPEVEDHPVVGAPPGAARTGDDKDKLT